MHALVNAVQRYVGKVPILVRSGMDFGMRLLIDNPGELGADRLVNAVAARRLYGGPCVVIDFGTATTFCFLNADGDYEGGLIYPGLRVSIDALVEKTAKLPRVEIRKPARVVGKNTVDSMQAGVVYGYTGMVDSLVAKIKAEQNAPAARTIATGGLAALIARDSTQIDAVDKTLTLKGLKIIYDEFLR
jgi:type III pantothenate kinase